MDIHGPETEIALFLNYNMLSILTLLPTNTHVGVIDSIFVIHAGSPRSRLRSVIEFFEF